MMATAGLWVVSPAGLNPAEQALLASLQGNLNRTEATLWIRGGGMNARVLEQLRAEGKELRETNSVWGLLAWFTNRVAGFVTCRVTDASLNVATSLAGPHHALIADESLRGRLEALGLTELFDARQLSELTAFAEFQKEFTPGIAVHQPVAKALHLRDLAVARNAFTFFAVPPGDRSRIVRELGPHTRVFGWGEDEHDFVRDVSRGGGAVIPADWSLNLSALQHLPTGIPARPGRPIVAPAKRGERIVAFVVTDGDNLQWMAGGFVDARGFWASPHRGTFPVTWELAPVLAEAAPRALAELYRTATPQDDFIAGPSGFGYQFPNFLPDRAGAAREAAAGLPPAQLRVVTVLNSGGDQAQADVLLEQPGVDAVFYKDYAPYNKARGAVRWLAGKPCVGYRFLLWESKGTDGSPRPDWLPEGVARAIGELPDDPLRNLNSFALVNVHAWSFRNSGGPMGAVERTVRLLPPGTRVVTASEFVALLGQVWPR